MSQGISDLKHAFLKQTYPETAIDAGIQRSLTMNKSELKRVRRNLEEYVVTLFSTLNQNKKQKQTKKKKKRSELFGIIRQSLNPCI